LTIATSAESSDLPVDAAPLQSVSPDTPHSRRMFRRRSVSEMGDWTGVSSDPSVSRTAE
jgi:hypothetical protein